MGITAFSLEHVENNAFATAYTSASNVTGATAAKKAYDLRIYVCLFNNEICIDGRICYRTCM